MTSEVEQIESALASAQDIVRAAWLPWELNGEGPECQGVTGEVVEWFSVRKRREDDPALRVAIDAMLAESQRLSEVNGIAPQLTTTRGELERFVRETLAAVARGEAPPPLFAESNWRREAFGDAIERIAGQEWIKPLPA